MSATSATLSQYPHLDVLQHLQQYIEISEDGHAAVKQSLWNIMKARRQATSGVVMVTQNSQIFAIGEDREFRARHRLFNSNNNPNDESLATTTTTMPTTTRMIDAEAGLVDEEDDNYCDDDHEQDKCFSGTITTTHVLPPTWNLKDLLEELEVSTQATGSNFDDTAVTATDLDHKSSTSNDVGLRQRKQTAISSQQQDGVKESSPSSSWTMIDETEEHEEEDEEQSLLRRDPLFVLGGWMPPRDLKHAQDHAKLALQHYVQAANQAAHILAMVNQYSKPSADDLLKQK